MTVTNETRKLVRERAKFACEYCGVTETDCGGELTIDHFQPQSKDGSDDEDNLIYCCVRCNQYKADYWREETSDISIWNPRQELFETHFLILVDGTLYPLTEIGELTIKRLRLNRQPLVTHRLQQQQYNELARLSARYEELITLLENLAQQQAEILEEQNVLLEKQSFLLKLLIRKNQ